MSPGEKIQRAAPGSRLLRRVQERGCPSRLSGGRLKLGDHRQGRENDVEAAGDELDRQGDSIEDQQDDP